MKGETRSAGVRAGLLLLLVLLCGCSRAQVPTEELQAAGNPVEGIPSAPQHGTETPDGASGEVDAPKETPLLEPGLCALLPKDTGSYALYDCYGQIVAVIPAAETDLAGVYPAESIVAGYRLTDGSPVLPRVSGDALWIEDAAGFSVCDREQGLLYRLDTDGTLRFSCRVPAEAEYVSLLPLYDDFLVSIWAGDGTEAKPWRPLVPCVVLDETGSVVRDLTHLITAPVVGMLGADRLLLAQAEGEAADVFDLGGNCLIRDVQPVAAQNGARALGGILCEYVWKDGWVYSSGLQPQQTCPDPRTLLLCGEHFSGVTYSIDGIDSNGQLLPCGEEAAVWAVEQGILAFQWQGINYHFPAGERQHEELRLCGKTMAVSYAWDEEGSGCFRLLFLESGAALEYDSPAGARVSALLQDTYALFATAETDGKTGGTAYRFWVVDDGGTLRWETSLPLRPCGTGPYLLCREETSFMIASLDGEPLISGAAP